MSFIDAEKLANEIYPEKLVSNPDFLGLYQDENASNRDIAVNVIKKNRKSLF